MRTEFKESDLPVSDTQLERIREVMLSSSHRGEWLTLAEIAMQTEFGEASISAQLRHLRKPEHGQYHVEKRRRRMDCSKMSAEEYASAAGCLWEYQVSAARFRNGDGNLRSANDASADRSQAAME